VDPDNVRPVEFNALLEAEKVAEATKQAIKRKIAQAASVDFQSRTLPAKLRIEPDDSEDVVSSAYIYYFYNACMLLVSVAIK
jgi:survival-of-motor-neuron-related-splicing factor 30